MSKLVLDICVNEPLLSKKYESVNDSLIDEICIPSELDPKNISSDVHVFKTDYLPKKLEKHLLCAKTSVSKLWVNYQNPLNDEIVTFVGSAFKVGNNLICTSKQNVPKTILYTLPDKKNNVLLKRSSVFFHFTSISNKDTFVSKECNFEMEVLDQLIDNDLDIVFCRLIPIDDLSSCEIWDKSKCSIPSIPPEDMTDIKCMVVGYPCAMSSTRFYEKQKNNFKELNYETVIFKFEAFEKRTVSISNQFIVTHEKESSNQINYIHHKCSTLNGFSGGMLFLFPSTNNLVYYFNGIHIYSDVNGGHAISVNCKRFYNMYKAAFKLVNENIPELALKYCEFMESNIKSSYL